MTQIDNNFLQALTFSESGDIVQTQTVTLLADAALSRHSCSEDGAACSYPTERGGLSRQGRSRAHGPGGRASDSITGTEVWGRCRLG